MHPNIPWPEEQVQRMLKLLDEGKSAGVVGALLGISRNAVIGKTMRMGLHVGVLNRFYERKVVKPKRVRPHLTIFENTVKTRPVIRFKSLKPGVPRAAPAPRLVINQPHRCTLMQLNNRSCHWPLWGLDTPAVKFYCGAPVSGKVYCADHHVTSTNRVNDWAYVKRDPSTPFVTKMRPAKSPKSMVT